jgi:peptidoglycan/LPS O-acetylase OafA/YrhL
MLPLPRSARTTPEVVKLPGVTPLESLLDGRRLPALDGLRAVSVLIVIQYHFGWQAVPGDLGVSVFFVLSGFLITWLLLKEHAATGTVSLQSFYWRRTLRIFPAYYAFLLVSLGWDSLRGDTRSAPAIVPALTYTINYFNAFHGHPSSSIAHAWSLAVEEQFYLIWPALFLLAMYLGRVGVGRVLAIAIGAVAGWRSLIYLSGIAGPAYVYNAFDTRFDNLAVGCLLAVVLTQPRIIRSVSRLPMTWWAPLGTLSLLVASRIFAGDRWHYSVGFTIDAILIAVLITQLMLVHAHPAWNWLEHRSVRWMGALSYPLYLYHGYGISLARRLPGLGQGVSFGVAVASATAIAAVSYYAIEQPALRLKSRGFRGAHSAGS